MEIGVTTGAEVGRRKAEINCDGATEPALVLEVLDTVAPADFGSGNVAAPATEEFIGVVGGGGVEGLLTGCFAPEIGLPTLGTQNIYVSFHGEGNRILIIFRGFGDNGRRIQEAIVLEAEFGLFGDILEKSFEGLQKILERRVTYLGVAERAMHESEEYPGARPPLFESLSDAFEMEEMSTRKFDTRSPAKAIGEANNTEIIGILFRI